MAVGPIISWQLYQETMEIVTDFSFLGSEITALCNCSHEIKRRLLLERKYMTTMSKVRQLHPETDSFLLEAQNIRRKEDEQWERILRRGYESLGAPETPNLLEDKK